MSSRPGIFTDQHSALFKMLKPLIVLRSAHTVLLYAWLSNWNFSVKFLPHLQQNFTHTRSSSSFIVTLSLIQRTACAHAQFSVCSSTTNARSKTGRWRFVVKTWSSALSSSSALSELVGALFKKFCLFLNMPRRQPRPSATTFWLLPLTRGVAFHPVTGQMEIHTVQS